MAASVLQSSRANRKLKQLATLQSALNTVVGVVCLLDPTNIIKSK
jgi:hypothetical protein